MSKRKARPAPKTKARASTRARKATNGSGKSLVPPKGSRKKKPRGARSQVLPGMEAVRSSRLDLICEEIAEIRAARGREPGLIASALQVMKRDQVAGYSHAGVELELVPGVDKVKVHVLANEGVTEVDPPKKRRQSPIPEAPKASDTIEAMGQTAPPGSPLSDSEPPF